MKMHKDPRVNNQCFEADNVSGYLSKYAETLNAVLAKTDRKSLENGFNLIRDTVDAGNKIFVAGNGGSAAIADHLSCDWSKGTASPNHPPLVILPLSSSLALMTAIANDYGYEHVIAGQLDLLASTNDLLILISSSGNSTNMIEAARKAKTMRIKTIGLTGFSGGELPKHVDVNIHANYNNYGIVEDCHQIIMHSFAQYFAKLRDEAR